MPRRRDVEVRGERRGEEGAARLRRREGRGRRWREGWWRRRPADVEGGEVVGGSGGRGGGGGREGGGWGGLGLRSGVRGGLYM
jgi:hypothetical protein